MKVPDEEIIRKVYQWLSFADEDIRFAQYGLTMKTDAPFRLIAYHAQQCVEKHLKAYLVFRVVDFPYTHNIGILLDICSRFATWTNNVRVAEELTPFAITTRYPGEDEMIIEKEASNAVEIAMRVRDVVRQGLRSEGFLIKD